MQREGMKVDVVMAEFSFVPVGFSHFPEPAAPVATGEPGVVAVKRAIPLDQKFVLRQDDKGLWAIDLVGSITATTGLEKSFLASQLQRAGGAAGGQGMRPYECMQHLGTLARAMVDYADEHDGNLPVADTWMDDLMPYVLDREVFKCPAAPELECGYAMNLEVSGMALPTDWGQRHNMVLLFEWPADKRNASAFPDELETMEPRHGEEVLFATADGNTQSALRGETPADAFSHQETTETCLGRMRALCKAVRDYAKDHDGLLPGANTWCDDIAPYLIQHPDGNDVFVCPAVPESPCGYALNADIAGKNAKELVGHSRIVVLMESNLGTRNASASASGVTAEDRHRAGWIGQGPTGSHFGYLDGNVMFAPSGQSPPRRP
jgi:hypothetical protein